MSIHETEALVLKSYALAEADKIVIFLTRSHGIVRGVAKGAKRLTSKFGGSLEPFSVVRIEFYQSGERELVTIRNAEIVETLFKQASDPVLLRSLSYFSEILMAFTPPSDPDDRLYRMTRICVESAAAQPEAVDLIVTYFDFWILRLGGFLPPWSHCSHCDRSLEPIEDAALRADFRLACAACERIRQQNRVSGAWREVFAAVQRMTPAQFVEFARGRERDALALGSILKRMIAGVLGKEGATAG
jgi:DNA repair protein RecO (recombination protein O)